MTATPDRHRTRPVGWGLGDALVGWLIAYSSAAVLGALILTVSGHADTPRDDLPMVAVALTYPPLWIGFIGVPWIVSRLKGNGLVRDFRLRFRPSDLVGVPIGVITQFPIVPLVSWPFLELAGRTFEDLGESAVKLTEKAGESPLGVVLLIAIVVIGAPIAEEIFFRGLVLRAFEQRFGTTIAIIASSLIFGATHFQALQIPALTVAGAVFALLAVRFDRLGPAILAHMGFNALTVVNLLWFDA